VIFSLTWFPGSSAGDTETLPDDEYVDIVPQRQDGKDTLVAQMTNCTEATITCDVTKLNNAIASRPLPVTLDTAGRNRVEIVIVQRLNPRLPWSYSWKCSYRHGRRSPLRK